MKHFQIFLFLLGLILISCQPKNTGATLDETIIRIAFGSCGSHQEPLPLLNVAADKQLDAFIFLGDNVYGDTRDMEVLQKKYEILGNRLEFKKLWNATTVWATWDDHDYGENDAGRHYPFKEESKRLFMDFWKIDQDSDQRNHKGIYGSEYLKKGDINVQVIILDTRTFRDDLLQRDPKDSIFHKNDYVPNMEADSTFLGKEQWMWLENELKVNADIRIIASSNQFSHEYNGWESWTNVPYEQQKMINLIQKTEANAVIFISGDVHWGEVSKMSIDNGYPLYDVTSSGIVQTWHNIEPNKNRIGSAIPQNNIGLIEITHTNGIQVKMSIVDSTALPVVSKVVDIDEISF